MTRWRRVRDALAAAPVGPLAVAALAGALAYAVSVLVFPYHSTNHDEAVYLQQAAMLLDGQLFLRPPVDGAFRPWFFVESAQGLYPKYAPPTAVVYALGELAGDYRYALPAVAAANVGLLYGVVREAFDHRTGLLAAVCLVCSPMFVVQSGVFLPYAPTTMLNLAFAFAYFRAERTGSARWATIAGAAVGAAFFSRPFTSVLFAAPFVVHAVWTLRGPLRERAVTPLFRRRVATAGLGLAGVATALGYNAVVTGHALVFPYQAFAPLDGLGFGHREILGYEQQYTVRLALRSNAEVAWEFLAEWGPFGALGPVLAVLGGVAVHRRGWAWRQRVLAGVAASVLVGNVYFWGNRNVLGDLADHSDGLIDTLGPYYHFDLLVPASAFAAVGILAAFDGLRGVLDARLSDARARPVAVAVLLVGSAALGGVAASATAEPVRENAAFTDHYEVAYEPFEPSPPDDAVVLLPDPYGDWLNHPFQYLRNDPGFDGDTVYALRDHSFEVWDAYPDRETYRYVYRGPWSPYSAEPVDPDLHRVSMVSGDALTADVEVGLPDWTAGVTLTLESGDRSAYYTLDGAATRERAAFDIVVRDGRVGLDGPVSPTGNATIPLNGTVEVRALVDGGYGAGFSYGVRLPVEETADGYRALTPYRELCTDLQTCEGSAVYVPGVGPEGASLNVSVRAN
ncbi:glycosyltransferase family 39 protein [Halobacterium litoreum]|uniref:Glycosyltransferase family 39 protein n=2 Tax=Halobacterium litoreum TaxID=2039234 RepID=A0ABD5N9C0_9EURY|nr:glycosyltransferase family 39 protein [Halobacterium litoreum]UHH14861.1 glycosyltransferase family 39 protein [Halobacterium litoreum]